MRYIDEFRDKKIIQRLITKIKDLGISEPINIMNVCGTHTVNFFKFGLNTLIPENIKVISGPGCPVCVSEEDFIDKAVAYSELKDIIIVSFGDLLKVRGTTSSLKDKRSQGKDIRVVYSSLDTLEIAINNPKKRVLFLGVGFETTAPTIGLTIKEAKKRKIKNLFFLLSLKRIPPVMEYLLNDKEIKIQGFLCPGHVSTIIGTKPYEEIVERYKLPCCVAGFEPLDILEAIYILLREILEKKPSVYNQYQRVVKKMGNPKALRIINEIFKIGPSCWRGMGKVENSGFILKDRYIDFDIERIIPLRLKKEHKKNLCLCGEVLKGKVEPLQCPLYAKVCSPLNPYGPCMVSQEGACYAYYRYQRKA